MERILESIMECMARSREQGFEPIAILMNDNIWEEEVKYEFASRLGFIPETILGLTLILHPKVKDFFVVDNRSWVYQKF